MTSSQQFSHFFLHVNGRSHTTHTLVGRFSFFTPRIADGVARDAARVVVVGRARFSARSACAVVLVVALRAHDAVNIRFARHRVRTSTRASFARAFMHSCICFPFHARDAFGRAMAIGTRGVRKSDATHGGVARARETARESR